MLPGRMTPLHAHVPTEFFRSVFHLREVRSVNELMSVNEEDLKRLDRLHVECYPSTSSEKVDDSTYEFQEDLCIADPPEYVWCPPDDVVEEDRVESTVIHAPSSIQGEAEVEGENEEFSRKFSKVAHYYRPYRRKEEGRGEIEEEHGEDWPLTPAPSVVSEKTLLVDEWEDFDYDITPCQHNYRPEPLYSRNLSGNFGIDMILPDKTHFANALHNYHYNLCTKILGLNTMKKHFRNKVASHQGVGEGSSFHTIDVSSSFNKVSGIKAQRSDLCFLDVPRRPITFIKDSMACSSEPVNTSSNTWQCHSYTCIACPECVTNSNLDSPTNFELN